MIRYFPVELNPVPWTAPNASVGRRKGGTFVAMYAAPELKDYKEAVKEQLEGLISPIEGPVKLTFWFWRNLPTMAGNARHKAHQADATNMQKALEDALQGVLFANDRDVHDIRSIIVEQGPDAPSHIVIGVEDLIDTDLPPVDCLPMIWKEHEDPEQDMEVF